MIADLKDSGKGPDNRDLFENGCNVGKKSVKTLIEEGRWKRVTLTSFDAGLPDDVLYSSIRNRIKLCK